MVLNASEHLTKALRLFLLMFILTGIFYPLVVTGLAQFLFPWQANGSLILRNQQVIGSVLIGQAFNSPEYFWGRPSATEPYPYNASASSGSNVDQSSPLYLDLVKKRMMHLQETDPLKQTKIPIDLLTASGSGLDPDISPQAARYQVPRVAQARHLPVEDINQLLDKRIKPRSFFVLGEPRVNVLELNQALDQLEQDHVRTP